MFDFEYQYYNLKQGLTNYGRQFHVDWEHGDDGRDGHDWNHAVATIERARYLQNALINWGVNDPLKYDIIWIRPGRYAPLGEAPPYSWPHELMAPYFCHMIGLGIVGDGGQGVDIVPAAGPALAGMLSGTHIANIAFKVADASDVMDFNLGGSHMTRSLIENCRFSGDILTPCGIDCESAEALEVRNCWFYSFAAPPLGMTTGILLRAPGPHNAFYIHHNHIFAIDNGVLIEAACGASSQNIIADNFIAGGPQAATPPRVAVGIADLTGISFCLRNYIVATDCINHAGGNEYLIANREIQAGGAAIEFAGTN